MKTLTRLLPALAVLAVMAAGAPAAVAETTAPALGGTSLTDMTPTGTSTCSDYGTTGQYSVDGTTTNGAYPGAYTETGTFTASAFDPSTGRSRVTGWQSTFTIDSPNGDVTGTKTFVAGTSTGGQFNCGSTWEYNWLTASASMLRVQATIELPDGRTCSAVGYASNNLGVKTPTIAEQFNTSFTNDLSAPAATCDGETPPPPPPPPSEEPQTKQDCLNGGWRQYGFKNQGRCIRFVLSRRR